MLAGLKEHSFLHAPVDFVVSGKDNPFRQADELTPQLYAHIEQMRHAGLGNVHHVEVPLGNASGLPGMRKIEAITLVGENLDTLILSLNEEGKTSPLFFHRFDLTTPEAREKFVRLSAHKLRLDKTYHFRYSRSEEDWPDHIYVQKDSETGPFLWQRPSLDYRLVGFVLSTIYSATLQ